MNQTAARASFLAMSAQKSGAKTRAERGLPPYESPKKDWDVTFTGGVVQNEKPTRQQLRAAARDAGERPEVRPSDRQHLRKRSRDRSVMLAKSSARSTRQQIKRTYDEQSALAVARVYLNLDGAHERSPQLSRNVTRDVHRQAELLAKREEIEFTAALKQLEGGLLTIATNAGLR